MAMRFHAYMGAGNGAIECPDAKRFSHYVNGVRFWFAVHTIPDRIASPLAVSHWESGCRLCEIDNRTIASSVGMALPDIARRSIDTLCVEKTAKRVYDVLHRAESEKYGMMRG